jgi:hypothetical protein
MKWDRPEGPNHSSKRRTKVIVVEFLLSWKSVLEQYCMTHIVSLATYVQLGSPVFFCNPFGLKLLSYLVCPSTSSPPATLSLLLHCLICCLFHNVSISDNIALNGRIIGK